MGVMALKLKQKWPWLTIVAVLLIAAGGGLWLYLNRYTGPIPADIRAKAHFDLYYPDPAKLPKGYWLDTKSFKYISDGPAVIYSVRYGNGQKLVFSVQPKPQGKQIEQFAKTQIPLHLETSTPVGKALIGAIKDRSVNSLPTSGNSWVIVTGPINTDQERLKQTLKALVKDS